MVELMVMSIILMVNQITQFLSFMIDTDEKKNKKISTSSI